jgi:hypothetical protein
MYKSIFYIQPPTIKEFITDNNYLGNILGGNLYPVWYDFLIKQYGDDPYCEGDDIIILAGSIGQGKSTISLIVQLYNICRLLCLKNPHEYYNLIESTKIVTALFAITLDVANRVLFSQFEEWIMSSPFFKSKLNRMKGATTIFQNNIHVIASSRGNQLLGTAVSGVLLSEINFLSNQTEARQIYSTVSARRASRFKDKGRLVLGNIIVDSSSKSDKSFTDYIIRTLEDDPTNPKYTYLSNSNWDALRGVKKFSGKNFRVFTGSETVDPVLIDNPKGDLFCDEVQLELFESTGKIITVPEEYYSQFYTDLITSLRDLAGISTFSLNSFISTASTLHDTFCLDNKVSRDVISLPFDSTVPLIDFIDVDYLLATSSTYFIGLDLSYAFDRTGIAISRIDSYEERASMDPASGRMKITKQPIIHTDATLCIAPIPGEHMSIAKVENLITDLKNRGLMIGGVAADTYQSQALLQNLELRGIPTKSISVDRTKNPYQELRQLILGNKLKAPNHKVLIREISELEENNSKFDHPDVSQNADDGRGSKDVADALCASIEMIRLQAVDSKSFNTNDDVSNMLNLLGARSQGDRTPQNIVSGMFSQN